jgi:hypothetical protein
MRSRPLRSLYLKRAGARELKGAVIYRQGGKLYMMEEPNNESFQDLFESNF